MNEPRHLDLFSGIGGFALAAKWTGFKTIGFSEIDPYASAVLRKHWPDVPNFGDITKWREWPDIGDVQLITGGFPCQPFSCAGKRRGAADDRFLWPAMLDVIGRYRPTWVLGENVPGIIGMELDRVLADLEGIGFRTATLVVPAAGVDAKHRRDRVWVLAYSGSEQRALQQVQRLGQDQTKPDNDGEVFTLANPEHEQRSGAELDGSRSCAARSNSGERTENPSPTSGRGCILAHAHGGNAQRVIGGGNDQKERQEPPEGSIGLCDREREWPPEPSVGRVADGVPNRVDRLKALGNAIVPKVAAVILQNIRKLIN